VVRDIQPLLNAPTYWVGVDRWSMSESDDPVRDLVDIGVAPERAKILDIVRRALEPIALALVEAMAPAASMSTTDGETSKFQKRTTSLKLVASRNARSATGAALNQRSKLPRILKAFAEHFPRDKFPDGIPGPGLRPRNGLRDDLKKWDPTLGEVSKDTVNKAIRRFNAD
jgi:hypothetical protein